MDLFAEFFSSLRLIDLGASGLVVVIVMMILTGKLVPKAVADAWKDAYYTEKRAGEIKDGHIAELAKIAGVSVRALDALPRAGGGEPDSSDTAETTRR